MVTIDFLGYACTQNELSHDCMYEVLWLAASQPVYIFQLMMGQLGSPLINCPALINMLMHHIIMESLSF